MTANQHAPEVKSTGGDVALAFEDFARAFDAFKETNDERMRQIETKLASDVVTSDKLARIDAALDASQRRIEKMALERARPALGEADERRDPAADAEHKAAFVGYVRTGEAGGLKRLESKALSAGSGPDGGYLAPAGIEIDILRRLAAISPMRAIATVRTVSTGTFKKAYSATGPQAGWVAETAARAQTDSPVLAEMPFPAMELYAQPAATQTLLDDAVVDLERWIAEEVEQAFATQETAAFVAGNGTTQPKGFLTETRVADSAWEWGKLGFIATGAAGAFPTEDPSDVLVELVHALKAGHRQNASFAMNRKTLSAIRRFKDAGGNYLWQPPAMLGQPSTLMGFPVVELEDMPDIAADACAAAFGDFRRGYLVVDRAGVRVLRDPYSAKPYVLFYTTKRVGGGVQDFEAIKLLKFAA